MTRPTIPASTRAAVSPVAALAVLLAVPGCATGSAAESQAPTQTTDAAPTTLVVFAAASLTDAFDEIADRFEAEYPNVDVSVSYGGSGALAQQVVAGAPADVFASASEPPMQTVVDAGLAHGPVVFATNTLELVVPAGNPAGVTGLADLARDELRVAMCDASVPCGAASLTLLENAGVTPAPDTLEQDVKAVLTKVMLGEVDAALVYRTDVSAAGDAVEGLEAAGADAVVNRYPITVTTSSESPDTAAAFVEFVTGPAGRAVLEGAGFGSS